MTAPILAVETALGRMYRHPLTGELVPSVTNIIKAGVAKPQLVGWAARMAAEHAVGNWDELSRLRPDKRVMAIKGAHEVYADKASDTGDVVHALIEAWSTGQPFPAVPKEINGFVNSFINFMIDARPKFIESEVTLWSRTHGYAGTADWIARIGDKNVLGDNKTGKRIYPEAGLQLAALVNADFIIRPDGSEEKMPRIQECAVLHVRPRSWKYVEMDYIDECFQAFLGARQVLFWQQNTAQEVFHRG